MIPLLVGSLLSLVALSFVLFPPAEAKDNVLLTLLNLPAPPPPNPLVTRRAQIRDPKFYSKKDPPKDEKDDAFMGGSDKPFSTKGVGKVWATNLTPDPEFGIARFSDAQVKDALRKGLRLEDAKPEGVPLRYVGRPWRASPSEGYPTAHLREQDRIVRAALGTAPA